MELTIALAAALTALLALGRVVYSTGRTNGRILARLHGIENRLAEIEGVMSRLGYPFRLSQRAHGEAEET